MSRTSYAVHRVPRDNTGMNSAPGAANGPRRYCDGQGLYLFVQPSGTRSWVQRLVVRGRHQELGLGSAQLVPLAEAREKALANRKLAREGGDPLAEKRRAEKTPTFADAARRVLDQQRAGWQSSRHSRSWLASLERYAFPRIGTRLISDVTSADVLEILTPIWHDKAQTARRVRQRIRAVLEWPWRWSGGPTTPATGSGRSSARSRRWWRTGGRCPIRTWPRPSRRSACLRRPLASRWRASGSC